MQSSKVTQLAIIFAAFVIFESQGQTSKSLTCTIATTTWTWFDFRGNLQTCEIENQTIDQEGFVVSGSPDSSIEAFYIKNDKNVKFIPEKLAEKFPKLIAIEFWNCAVGQVRRSHFKDLNKLKDLILARNEITDIESESFDDLHQLEDLNLSWNKLSHLHRDLFRSLANLKKLWLNDNQIEEIDENLLKTNRKLERVWFDNNKLAIIPSETFSGPQNLKYLDLERNQCIDKFWGSPNHEEVRETLASKCSKTKSLENIEDSGSKLIELSPSPTEGPALDVIDFIP